MGNKATRVTCTKLKDKVLGCFCKSKPCHGDTLAELADNNGQSFG
jgi:hypothetical protein